MLEGAEEKGGKSKINGSGKETISGLTNSRRKKKVLGGKMAWEKRSEQDEGGNKAQKERRTKVLGGRSLRRGV